MRYRRIISAVLVPATLLLFTGCTKTEWISPEEYRPKDKLIGVVTAESPKLKFDRVMFKGDSIYAYAGADTIRFTLSEVERVGVQRPDPAATAGIIVGAVFVAALAAVAIGSFYSLSAWSINDSSLEH